MDFLTKIYCIRKHGFGQAKFNPYALCALECAGAGALCALLSDPEHFVPNRPRKSHRACLLCPGVCARVGDLLGGRDRASIA